jgi:uncharacterized membrane protein
METTLKVVTLFLAILLTGLSAGFFFSWEVSVIPGTKQVSDRNYLETMQSINRAILNPAFFAVFIGSLLCLIVASYMQYRAGINFSFWLTLAATLIYLIGTFGVTIFGNVPMNESLEARNLAMVDTEGLRAIRTSFEGRWNQLHSIRTVFAVLSLICILLAGFVQNSNH